MLAGNLLNLSLGFHIILTTFVLEGARLLSFFFFADLGVSKSLRLTANPIFSYSAQVVSGPDPVTIRAKLKAALPRAPTKQLVSTRLTCLVMFSFYASRNEANVPYYA